MLLYREELESPLGLIDIITDGRTVRAVDFRSHELRMIELMRRYLGPVELRPATTTSDATSRLIDYFAGDVAAVEALKVTMTGTAFQQRVWAALLTIPSGITRTYQQIAEQIGSRKACRAVGLANGANPIAIVVPCHRVIGANQTLTGYGGGLERKRWLLQHEGVTLATSISRRAALQVA